MSLLRNPISTFRLKPHLWGEYLLISTFSIAYLESETAEAGQNLNVTPVAQDARVCGKKKVDIWC